MILPSDPQTFVDEVCKRMGVTSRQVAGNSKEGQVCETRLIILAGLMVCGYSAKAVCPFVGYKDHRHVGANVRDRLTGRHYSAALTVIESLYGESISDVHIAELQQQVRTLEATVEEMQKAISGVQHRLCHRN